MTRRYDSAAVAAIITILAVCTFVASARAEFGLVPGSFTADSYQQNGDTETQAGIHPYRATTSFDFSLTDGKFEERPRDVEVQTPPGFIGNPEATPKCSQAAFVYVVNDSGSLADYQKCPAASQVGLARIRAKGTSGIVAPVYNLEPPYGVTAQLGIPVLAVPVILNVTVNTAGDYSVRAKLTGISTGIALTGSTVDLWGVPAASDHDAERAPCGAVYGFTPCPVGALRTPFLTNPSACAGPLTSTITFNTWQRPGLLRSDAFTTASGITGCDKLRFDPSIEVKPTSSSPDSPTGMDVSLTLPQGDDPATGLAPPPLRKTTVTLPEGMTINPASAGGLDACSDAQLGLHSDAPIACPEASKIGTVTATTPVLKNPIKGSVILRAQASMDPESGDMFRITLVLKDEERGLLIKLPGQVRANATTGRLSATFDDNPQLPVESVDLAFKSGPRAPLATSPTCGSKSAVADLTSWGRQSVTRESASTLTCPAGLGGFAPTVTAGTTPTTAGAFAPFAASMSKPDGNAAVSGWSMVLPTGLLAKLKGNLGTQVGTVKAFAGPGSNPFMLPGQVFLEGAYGDAPFSLKVVVPAKAGPFDLGEVVVRQKIYVDPITAQVTVVSDPIPTIVKGVPARLQRLDVNVDKPGFTVNPTSCAAKAIGGTLGSADGQSAPINLRFQVSDCALLAVKPSLALTLSGKGQTTDGKHPAISATLTQPSGGQANLKKVRVALPLSLALDPDNANGLCEFVDGSKPTPTCPKASIVGSVTATTPILDEPLSGPVYFVKNIRKDPKSGREIRTLPKLVIPLVGQNGVKLTLTGTSDVVDDQLVTTFDNIPDAPVSSFKLDINGGKGGILTVSGADICKSTQIADQQVDGQNSKDADADVFIQTPSCPIKILSTTVGKTAVKLKIGGLGAGKVTVTGRGIRKTTKTISKSTVATVTAKRTGHGKPGSFKVRFTKAKAAVA